MDRIATAKTRALEPIYERDETTNEFALVPTDNPEKKKQRNLVLKQRARLISGGTNRQTTQLRYDREGTFVTGGGLPGRNRNN